MRCLSVGLVVRFEEAAASFPSSLDGRSKALVGEFLVLTALRWIPSQLLQESLGQSSHSDDAGYPLVFVSAHFRESTWCKLS